MDLSECQGNCLKYLERGWKRKEERGHKDFKKRRQARSRGGCLKKGGGVAGTSLRTMIYIYIYIYIYSIVARNIIRVSHPWSGDSQGQETF